MKVIYCLQPGRGQVRAIGLMCRPLLATSLLFSGDEVTSSHWSATVPVPDTGDMSTVVETESSGGNVNAIIHGLILKGSLRLSSSNLSSGEVKELIEHKLDLDTNQWLFAHIQSIDYVQSEDIAYLSLKYFGTEDGDEKSALSVASNLLSTTIDVDSEENFAYLSGFRGFTKVNLNSGVHEVFSLDEHNDFNVIIQDLEIDIEEQALYVLIGSYLSKSGSIGEGLSIEGATDVAVDSKTDTAYIVSQSLGAVFEVKLSTGDRKLFLDHCENSSGQNQLLNDGGIQSISFNETSQELLITARSLFKLPLDGGDCEAADGFLSLFDAVPAEDNTIIGSYFNTIYLIDFESSEKVIISK